MNKSSGIEDEEWLSLSRGEEVVWHQHPTVLMYLPRYLAGLLVAAAGLALFAIGWQAARGSVLVFLPLIVALAGLSYIAYSFVHRHAINYIATTEKVVKKTGIVSRNVNPVYYDRVSNVKRTESIRERVVSFMVPGQEIGDIHIDTADDDLGDLELRNVSSLIEADRKIQRNLSGSQYEDE